MPRLALARRAPRLAVRVAALLILALPLAAGAQKEPRRPRLPAQADTNDAQVYYNYGLTQLDRDPEQAADAFYWSTRLNPMFADAWYARRVALLLTDRRRLLRYWEDDRRTLESKDIRQIDSLFLRARTINPFVSQVLDGRLLEMVIHTIADEATRGSDMTAGEYEYWFNNWLRTAPADFRARRAYTDGRFVEALDLYAEAIRRARQPWYAAYLRAERGRILSQLNRGDSAVAELTAAVEQMRKEDKKDLVYVYESKALLEHSIGVIQYRLGNVAGAKEAFGRALEEDLSYAPAHTQLAFVALDGKDTTTALSELDLAVQIDTANAGLRYLYGYTLATATKLKDAEAQLTKASALDPYFALPQHLLAQIYDQTGRESDALGAYKRFLALAAQSDPRRDEATDRASVLGTAAQAGTAKP